MAGSIRTRTFLEVSCREACGVSVSLVTVIRGATARLGPHVAPLVYGQVQAMREMIAQGWKAEPGETTEGEDLDIEMTCPVCQKHAREEGRKHGTTAA